jgi:hypothetical protein
MGEPGEAPLAEAGGWEETQEQRKAQALLWALAERWAAAAGGQESERVVEWPIATTAERAEDIPGLASCR